MNPTCNLKGLAASLIVIFFGDPKVFSFSDTSLRECRVSRSPASATRTATLGQTLPSPLSPPSTPAARSRWPPPRTSFRTTRSALPGTSRTCSTRSPARIRPTLATLGHSTSKFWSLGSFSTLPYDRPVSFEKKLNLSLFFSFIFNYDEFFMCCIYYSSNVKC